MSQIQYLPEPKQLMALQPGDRIFIGPAARPAHDPDLLALSQQIFVATVTANLSNHAFLPGVAAALDHNGGAVNIDPAGHLVAYPAHINIAAPVAVLGCESAPMTSTEHAIANFIQNFPKPKFVVSLHRIDITPIDRLDNHIPEPSCIGRNLPTSERQLQNIARYFQIDAVTTLDDGSLALCSAIPHDTHELAGTGIEKYYQIRFQAVDGQTPTDQDILLAARELGIQPAEQSAPSAHKPQRTMRMG